MASTLVQHKVKDFAEWKKVFDSHATWLSTGGALGAQIFHDASDPNNVAIIQKWASMEHAQKMFQNPELKSNMEQAGVVGAPTVTFLNEA